MYREDKNTLKRILLIVSAVILALVFLCAGYVYIKLSKMQIKGESSETMTLDEETPSPTPSVS